MMETTTIVRTLVLCWATFCLATTSPIQPSDGDLAPTSDHFPLSFINESPNVTQTTQSTTVTTNVTDRIEFDSPSSSHEARAHDDFSTSNHDSRSSDDLSSSLWPQSGTAASSSDNVTLFNLHSGAGADNSTFYSHSSSTNEDVAGLTSSSAESNSSAANVSGAPLTPLDDDDNFGIDHQVSPFAKLDDSTVDGAVKSSNGGGKLEGEETTPRNVSDAFGQNIFQSPPVPLPVEPEDVGKEDVSSDGATSEEPHPTKEKVAFGLNENEGADVGVTLATSTGGNGNPVTSSREALDAAEDEQDKRASILELHPTTSGSGATGTPSSIRFRANVESEWRPYVDNLAGFLDAYSKEAQERNVHCDFERSVRPGEEACRFDLVYLGPSCTKQNNFGYGIGKPCVLLSPAPIDGWVPAPYENDTTGVPDEIQRLMRIFNANFMFVMCEGETEADRANIGPMAYLPPYQGFPSYFFPNKLGSAFSSSSSSFGEAPPAAASAPHYVAPLMAIEFLNPANGTLIGVKCRAWAKNLADVPRKTTLRFSFQVN